ncbi:MAG: hypothetical protein A3G75_13525 [Verrucomicrobia bacterium RIFCSPLOWO2_12_FULL_64_8]|nr:MAG: hypothetical protein A3G75_13525 [Verrucomicrobia bacterium RIFCSPLOWO2_12_FULL_64_8]
MPLLSLKVPTETALRLERIAARRRISKSAVIREALEDKLRKVADEPTLHEAMKASLGVLDSGLADLGHNPKHLAKFGRK